MTGPTILLLVALSVTILATTFAHIYGQMKQVWIRFLYVNEALESISDRLTKLEGGGE